MWCREELLKLMLCVQLESSAFLSNKEELDYLLYISRGILDKSLL